MNTTHNSIARDISRVRRSLRTLDRALRRLTPAVGALPSVRANGAKPTTRVSAKVQAARVLQGRYMSYMRQLKPRQKAQIRKIREAKGVRAAIQRAKGLAQS